MRDGGKQTGETKEELKEEEGEEEEGGGGGRRRRPGADLKGGFLEVEDPWSGELHCKEIGGHDQ